jgi:putative endonuclease
MNDAVSRHHVYILRCADGTLYTGYARDPRAREAVHNTGRGARYTSGRRPVTLVYTETCATHGDALRREYQLKRLPREKKHALLGAATKVSASKSPRPRKPG